MNLTVRTDAKLATELVLICSFFRVIFKNLAEISASVSGFPSAFSKSYRAFLSEILLAMHWMRAPQLKVEVDTCAYRQVAVGNSLCICSSYRGWPYVKASQRSISSDHGQCAHALTSPFTVGNKAASSEVVEDKLVTNTSPENFLMDKRILVAISGDKLALMALNVPVKAIIWSVHCLVRIGFKLICFTKFSVSATCVILIGL